MKLKSVSPNAALEGAMHSRSRRDFLKTLCMLAGAALLQPVWQFQNDQSSIAVPPTLMLHSKDRWKLFNILKWLQDNGYNSITYRDFAAVLRGEATLPDKPIIITVDDVGSHYIQPYYIDMIDMINKHSYTGVLGIVTRQTPSENPDTWRKLGEFAQQGWELDTHTTHHPVLPLIKSEDKLRAEIIDSAKMIADGIGTMPTSLIVPYASVRHHDGQFDQRIMSVSAEGNLDFVVGMTQGRYINGTTPPYYVGRVGVGIDSVQTAWWITHFNLEPPGNETSE